MAIQLETVKNKKQKKDFVDLPFAIYRNNPFWVPPLRSDEWKMLDPAYHPARRFSDTECWIAYRDGKPAGRICAIINHKYNEKTGEKQGRFFKLEFFDDAEVFTALMDSATTWLKEKGMTTVHGPLGYTNLDNQGLLVQGFDYLPSVASVYHLPYYQTHIENYGFQKEIDWVEFRLTIGEKAVNKANRGAELLKKRFGFEVVRFRTKKELLSYIDKIFDLINHSFSPLPFVAPFDKETADFYTKKYITVIDPQYVFLVKKEEELIGFMLAVPSLSEALQKANGRLFPLGFCHIRKAIKHPEVIDFFLAGVQPKYEHTGAAVVLYAEIQNQMLKNGLHIVETTGEFETNQHAISNWKNFDHIQHKRRRCFIKKI